jgi:hypothetical protein
VSRGIEIRRGRRSKIEQDRNVNREAWQRVRNGEKKVIENEIAREQRDE